MITGASISAGVGLSVMALSKGRVQHQVGTLVASARKINVLGHLSVFLKSSTFISQELGPDMKKELLNLGLQTSLYTLHPLFYLLWLGIQQRMPFLVVIDCCDMVKLSRSLLTHKLRQRPYRLISIALHKICDGVSLR